MITMTSSTAYLWIVVILPCFGTVEAVNQSNVATDPRVFLVRGASGLLPCWYHGSGNVSLVVWNNEYTVVNGSSTPLVSLDVRFDDGSRRSGVGIQDGDGRFNITDDFSLVIEDIQVRDNGRYFCQIAVNETGQLLTNYTDVIVNDFSSRTGAVIDIFVAFTLLLVLVIALLPLKPQQEKTEDDPDKDEDVPVLSREVAEAEGDWTAEPSKAVKLRKVDEKYNYSPITVQGQFYKIKKKYENKVALAAKNSDAWTEWTYGRYWELCKAVAKSLIKLGLTRHQRVVISAWNTPEWVFTYMGSIFSGVIAVGIDKDYQQDDFWFVVDDCQPVVLFVQNADQVRQILEGLDQRRHHLTAVVQYDGALEVERDFLYTWSQFLELGHDVKDDVEGKIMANQSPNECCSITYTKSTTSSLKGAMFSHDNV